MTAGEIHYFLNMSSNPKQFASEIVTMAVKGLLTIDYKKKLWGGTYTLTKMRDFSKAIDTPWHQKITSSLFRKSNTVELTQTNQETLQATANDLETHYIVRESEFFTSSLWIIMLPVLIGFLSLIIGAFVHLQGAVAFMWIALIFYLFAGILGAYLTKSYTPEGCVIKNKILGFKLFLSATEKDRMEMIGTPPTKTPELYEKYLPYAIALGVERQWTQQFASVFAQLEKQGVHYQPVWYHGGSFDTFNPTTFSSQISNSLQSASQSSGSGGSGGGSSGGGRGGGGGGSW